jgi:MFS family permease
MGIAFCFVPISIAALAGVRQDEAGLASGLINTTQQIGGALGIAVLSSIAISATDDKLGAGVAVPDALVSGFQAAFWVGAATAAVGFVAALVLVRDSELAPVQATEMEPVLEPV